MSKNREKLRIYTDTSVIGGCCDPEFASYSGLFIDMARAGRINLLISQVVLDELARAPVNVQNILKSIPTEYIEYVELTSEVVIRELKQKN
jgi:hypothetical protein